jgi:hypothetical protein
MRLLWSCIVDVMLGLLAAGVIAPATLLLPERWRGPAALWLVAFGAIASVAYVRHGRARR